MRWKAQWDDSPGQQRYQKQILANTLEAQARQTNEQYTECLYAQREQAVKMNDSVEKEMATAEWTDETVEW